MATLTACGGKPPVESRTTTSAKPMAVWGNPTNGQKPRALVILIPGGGWTGINPAALQTEVATSVIFRRVGYATLSVDYRAGAQGVNDVDRFYRQARKRVGPQLPICAFGASAGAQVALMLAVRHPDLRCVVALAGPTDLPAFAKAPGKKTGYKLALAAFGSGGLANQSPVNFASKIKAKLLLAYAQNDPIVPASQGEELKRKIPGAKLVVLPPGTATFVHTGTGAPVSESGVSPIAKAALAQEEAQFLLQATAH